MKFIWSGWRIAHHCPRGSKACCCKMDWSDESANSGYFETGQKSRIIAFLYLWRVNKHNGGRRRAYWKRCPRRQRFGPTAAAQALRFKWNIEHWEGLCSNIAFPSIGKILQHLPPPLLMVVRETHKISCWFIQAQAAEVTASSLVKCSLCLLHIDSVAISCVYC